MGADLGRLARDSEPLGVPVVVAVLDDVPVEGLPELLEEARVAGARCVVGELNPERSHAIVEVQRYGFRLAEAGVTLHRRPTDRFTPRPSTARVRAGTNDDLDALGDVVESFLRWSGYAEDPRLGDDAARRVLEARLDASSEAGDGSLLVAEEDGRPTGLALLAGGQPDRVELLGVRRPGTGTADALLAAAIEQAAARDEGLEAGPCAAANIAALRFFERAGFVVAGSRYRYLCWLDEPEARP